MDSARACVCVCVCEFLSSCTSTLIFERNVICCAPLCTYIQSSASPVLCVSVAILSGWLVGWLVGWLEGVGVACLSICIFCSPAPYVSFSQCTLRHSVVGESHTLADSFVRSSYAVNLRLTASQGRATLHEMTTWHWMKFCMTGSCGEHL